MHSDDSPPDGIRDADPLRHVDADHPGFGGFGRTGQSDLGQRSIDPDQGIREDVRKRLADADLDETEIEVTVQDGEVVLEGTVEDRWAKRDAEDLAGQARGVTGVHNRLGVRSSDPTQTQRGSSTSARGDRAR